MKLVRYVDLEFYIQLLILRFLDLELTLQLQVFDEAHERNRHDRTKKWCVPLDTWITALIRTKVCRHNYQWHRRLGCPSDEHSSPRRPHDTQTW